MNHFKMKVITFWFIFLALRETKAFVRWNQDILDSSSNRFSRKNMSTDVSRLGAGFIDTTDFAPVPFIAVFTDNSYRFTGMGVIYNKYWIITSGYKGIELSLNYGSSYAFTGVYDLLNLGTSQAHMVKRVVIHPDYTTNPDPGDDVSVVRICPPFEPPVSFVTVPTSINVPSATPVTLYSFDLCKSTKLQSAGKVVGADTPCTNGIYDYVISNTYCLAADASVYVEIADRNNFVLVMKGNEYYGHISGIDNNQFVEAVFKVNNKAQWIIDNAPENYDLDA